MKELIIRIVLKLFPFDFRRELGRELEETYHDRRQDPRGFWRSVFADAFHVAPRQHAETVRHEPA